MEKDMELRKFIATTIREYLNEQKILNEIEKVGYDDLFIKLAWLKYYGEGSSNEIKNQTGGYNPNYVNLSDLGQKEKDIVNKFKGYVFNNS